MEIMRENIHKLCPFIGRKQPLIIEYDARHSFYIDTLYLRISYLECILDSSNTVSALLRWSDIFSFMLNGELD